MDYDHQGIQATTIVREELGALPAIRPLLLVLKTYLGKLGLNITWTGGLSSHALFLMVRAYCLSIARAAPTDDVSSPTDLGAALLGLLEWYGSFDFSRVQICWDKEQPFAPRPPLAAARGYSPPPLVVGGFDNKNVALKAFGAAGVVAALSKARDPNPTSP